MQCMNLADPGSKTSQQWIPAALPASGPAPPRERTNAGPQLVMTRRTAGSNFQPRWPLPTRRPLLKSPINVFTRHLVILICRVVNQTQGRPVRAAEVD
jgi:hypothetical protein